MKLLWGFAFAVVLGWIVGPSAPWWAYICVGVLAGFIMEAQDRRRRP